MAPELADVANIPAEVPFRVGDVDDAPDRDITVVFSGGGRRWEVPAFWAGENAFRARFAAPSPGTYEWRVLDDDVAAGSESGTIDVREYAGANELYRRGRLRVRDDRRALEHSDGTPFFWLGDTWWTGLSPRLPWPDGFRELTADRVSKGFNVVQLVVGPVPCNSAWNAQQANEAGWSWEPGWERLNPGFYDAADMRIAHLVEQGIVPCIFATWGSFFAEMGAACIRRHWRNLVARYAAYPVVFCMCGEADKDSNEQRREWSEIGRYVRELDPFQNLITIHPGPGDGRTCLDDDSVLDLNMLQTSHVGYSEPPSFLFEYAQSASGLEERPRSGLALALAIVSEAVAKQPAMPVINGEPAYEGSWGTYWQDVQRFLFWTNVLTGAVGHTYGAQGIWSMNSATDPWLPDPRYPDSGSWQNEGAGTWQEAMHYAGGRQVALGRQFFERYRWWAFEPLMSEEAAKSGRRWSFAAGVPGEVTVVYLPSMEIPDCLQGLSNRSPNQQQELTIPLEQPQQAFFFDPRTATDIQLGDATPDGEGRWRVPRKPTCEDWVLVLETAQARDG